MTRSLFLSLSPRLTPKSYYARDIRPRVVILIIYYYFFFSSPEWDFFIELSYDRCRVIVVYTLLLSSLLFRRHHYTTFFPPYKEKVLAV